MIVRVRGQVQRASEGSCCQHGNISRYPSETVDFLDGRSGQESVQEVEGTLHTQRARAFALASMIYQGRHLEQQRQRARNHVTATVEIQVTAIAVTAASTLLVVTMTPSALRYCQMRRSTPPHPCGAGTRRRRRRVSSGDGVIPAFTRASRGRNRSAARRRSSDDHGGEFAEPAPTATPTRNRP